jgi:cytochrome c oxidase subunit 3
MWIFLTSELMMFSTLFTLYAAYRTMYPQAFAEGVRHNAIVIGSVNMLLLATSSLTLAVGERAVQADRPRRAAWFIGATVCLGLAFLVLKLSEWGIHLGEGIAPGASYQSAGLQGHGLVIFFTLYYLMTGLHAIHMLVGIVVLGVIGVNTWRRRYGAAYHVPLELMGLYWHLVHIVWVFLWPMLYLMRE